MICGVLLYLTTCVRRSSYAVARHLHVETPDTEGLGLIFFCLTFKLPNGRASWHRNNRPNLSNLLLYVNMYRCSLLSCNSECQSEPVALNRKKTPLKPSSVQRALFNCWRFKWIQTLGLWFILQNRTGFCLYFCFLCQDCKADGFQTTEIVHGRYLMKTPDWNMILTMEKEKTRQTWFFQSWEKSEGKGLFCLKYVLNSTLQSAMGAYTEVKLFVLIQHKLMLGMTVENYMAFVSLKNAYIGVFSPK